MTLRFTDTQRASVNHGVKLLVYAESGLGKTVLCATCPQPLIISNESGLLSLAPANLERMEKVLGRQLPRNLTVVEISTYQELYECYQWCLQSREAQQYWTVCLDSASEIAERILENAKSQFKDPRQAYGKLAEETFKLIRAFRELPGKHVYMSAKQNWVKDEVSGASHYQPSFPGRQLGPGLPYFFDEVFNLNVGVAQGGVKYRYLRTQPDPQYTAKDRSGSLAEIERPDLGYVIHKIMGA